MIKDYKLVAIVCCGRKQYLDVLLPIVYKQECLDKIILFSNSSDKEDNAFIEKFRNFEKTEIYQSKFVGEKLVQHSFDEIYEKICVDGNTIYFKIDDDIVFMSPDCLKKMAEFKIESGDKYFLVYPFIANNPFCNLFLAKNDFSSHLEKMKFMTMTWRNPAYAYQLHKTFTNLKSWTNAIQKSCEIGPEYNGMPINVRPSINLIAGTAKDFQSFHEFWKDKIDVDIDEQYMTKEYLIEHRKKNYMVGTAVASHYAFFIQRNQLKPYENDLLSLYKKFAIKAYNDEFMYEEKK